MIDDYTFDDKLHFDKILPLKNMLFFQKYLENENKEQFYKMC